MAFSGRFAPALLATACVVACGEAPKPRVITIPAVPDSAPKAPSALPARWINAGGATLIGPRSQAGTVVLVGGRRALAMADGTTLNEKSAAPEPLFDLIEVPTAQGSRIVGRGLHGVYRFDDPLGPAIPLARSRPSLRNIGALPGIVAVWANGSGRPSYVDVLTQQDAQPRALPGLPMGGVAFLDDKRGAAIFEVAGLAITLDGGKTWAPVDGADGEQTFQVHDVRRDGDALRASSHLGSYFAWVDVDHHRIPRLALPEAPTNEPALLRWIRATSQDPLEAAATSGVNLPGGGALVASHGLFARVDLDGSRIVDITQFARGNLLDRCGVGRVEGSAWFGCHVSDSHGSEELYEPFALFQVRLTDRPPIADPPALLRNGGDGETDVRISPSGGILAFGDCEGTNPSLACVRQKNGRFNTLDAKVNLQERGAGPLADGSVAFLRGLTENEELGAVPTDGGPPSMDLRVSVIDASGASNDLAPLGFARVRGSVRIQSPIEELSDRSLRFVVEDGEGPTLIRVGGPFPTATMERLAGFAAARLHGSVGIAIGADHLAASTDGGETWVPATPPDGLQEELAGVAETIDEQGSLVVSEAGAKIGSFLRIGWGSPEAPFVHAPAAEGGVEVQAKPRAEDGPGQNLVCTLKSASTAPAPILVPSEARTTLEERPHRPGTRRQETWAPIPAYSSLSTAAVLYEEGPEGKNERPATWVFRWIDPSEIGARVRVARVKAPTTANWNANLRLAAARSGQALFEVHASRKVFLVRVSAGGGSDVTEAATKELPQREVVFGDGSSGAIAWIHDTALFTWLPGARPLRMARLATGVPRYLGQPTREGIPIFVGMYDWMMSRVLPLPSPMAGAAEGPPPVPSIDGYSAQPMIARMLGSLPACERPGRGVHLVLSKSTLRGILDGTSRPPNYAFYDVRVEGKEVCVAGIQAAFGGTTKGEAPSFVRFDFTRRRGDGGTRGPGGKVSEVTCSLGKP